MKLTEGQKAAIAKKGLEAWCKSMQDNGFDKFTTEAVAKAMEKDKPDPDKEAASGFCSLLSGLLTADLPTHAKGKAKGKANNGAIATMVTNLRKSFANLTEAQRKLVNFGNSGPEAKGRTRGGKQTVFWYQNGEYISNGSDWLRKQTSSKASEFFCATEKKFKAKESKTRYSWCAKTVQKKDQALFDSLEQVGREEHEARQAKAKAEAKAG